MDLREPAETAVRQCLALDADESCAVVTDDDRAAIGEALYAVASEVTDDAVYLQYPPGTQHGAEPPAPVAAALRDADAFLAPTTKSISHTRARSRACEAGARGATLPGITEEVFVAGLDADYEAIAAHCRDVEAQVAGADEIRVTSPQGTDITLEPGDREWRLDTGVVHDPGAFSNLPAGETFVSPQTATGTYVIDWYPREGRTAVDIAVEVEDGSVTAVDDQAISAALATAAEEVGDAAYNLAELGIGANTAVTDLVGSVLLDEKAAGTVHLAIGDDAGFGGDTDTPIHLDGILTEPTVYADGERVTLPGEE
ncbi:MAG: aminopeptidase [Halobacteriaceae archaeon]